MAESVLRYWSCFSISVNGVRMHLQKLPTSTEQVFREPKTTRGAGGGHPERRERRTHAHAHAHNDTCSHRLCAHGRRVSREEGARKGTYRERESLTAGETLTRRRRKRRELDGRHTKPSHRATRRREATPTRTRTDERPDDSERQSKKEKPTNNW